MTTSRERSAMGDRLGKWLQLLLVLFVAVLFATPFLWMVSASLKTRSDVFTIPPSLIPRVPAYASVNGQSYPMYTLNKDGTSISVAEIKVEKGVATVLNLADPGSGYFEVAEGQLRQITQPGAMFSNFLDAIERFRQFPRFVANTIVLCSIIVLGDVLSCSLVAYGFSRIEWPGRDAVFVLVLSTIMLPFWVTFVPLFITYRSLGWIDSSAPYKAYLIFIVPAFCGNAFDIFLLRQFFRTIPQELSDAARMDGASEWGIFWRVIMPLSKPILATVIVTTFLYWWNNFEYPLLYLNSEETYTLVRALTVFQQQRSFDWNLLMAASVLLTLPVILIFFFAQRSFIEGIKVSGIK